MPTSGEKCSPHHLWPVYTTWISAGLAMCQGQIIRPGCTPANACVADLQSPRRRAWAAAKSHATLFKSGVSSPTPWNQLLTPCSAGCSTRWRLQDSRKRCHRLYLGTKALYCILILNSSSIVWFTLVLFFFLYHRVDYEVLMQRSQHRIPCSCAWPTMLGPIVHSCFTPCLLVRACRALSGKLSSNFSHPLSRFFIFSYLPLTSCVLYWLYSTSSSSAHSLLSSFSALCSCACFAGSLTQFASRWSAPTRIVVSSYCFSASQLPRSGYIFFLILCRPFDLDSRGLAVGFFANLNLVCLVSCFFCGYA